MCDIFKRTRVCEKRQVEILEKFQEKMFKPLINSIIFISHLIQVKRCQENKRELKYPDSTHIVLYRKTKYAINISEQILYSNVKRIIEKTDMTFQVGRQWLE